MDPKTFTMDLEIQIEELEPKIAPDLGETVLPLPIIGGSSSSGGGHHH